LIAVKKIPGNFGNQTEALNVLEVFITLLEVFITFSHHSKMSSLI